MDLRDFHDSLGTFAAAASLDEIETLCHGYRERLGFDAFVYALRVPTQFTDSKLVLINGYPEGWVARYFEQSYFLNDPVMAYCSRHIVPVQWHQLAISPDSRSERMMRDASEFGLRAGLTMPVHSPQGELGILSFTVNRPDAAAQAITAEALPHVQLLASHLHEAVRRVSGLVDADDSRPLLTAREKECLRWAADGKTSWEIAQLLRTSERTINFHLNNAMQKLDVCNRQHAVAKAALQGMIHPHPF
jgi:DNA-binding CsgD family transcriptional regulator